MNGKVVSASDVETLSPLVAAFLAALPERCCPNDDGCPWDRSEALVAAESFCARIMQLVDAAATDIGVAAVEPGRFAQHKLGEYGVEYRSRAVRAVVARALGVTE